MGPVLGHTAERMRILTARVQMTGAEVRMGRQELGAPSNPREGEDIAQKPVLRGGQREKVAGF